MSEVRERKVGIRWLKVIMVAGLIVQIVPVLWLESSRAAGTEQMPGVIQGRTLTSMPLPSQSDPAGLYITPLVRVIVARTTLMGKSPHS